MQFYFSSNVEKIALPIYWQEFFKTLCNKSTPVGPNSFTYVTNENRSKTCQIIVGKETKIKPCDFHVSFEKFSDILRDEKTAFSTDKLVLLPYATFLERTEKKAEKLLLIVDKQIQDKDKILIDHVRSVLDTQYPLDIIISETLLTKNFLEIQREFLIYKKVISCSYNIALNHWFSLLFNNDFILLFSDDSSPLRYAYLDQMHPFLRQEEQSKSTKKCHFFYSELALKLRNLIEKIKAPIDISTQNISFEKYMNFFENQCLNLCKTDNKFTYFSHCKQRKETLSFSLKEWVYNKQSLPLLANFITQNRQNTDIQQLLVSYLLTFFHYEYWPDFEEIYAKDAQILSLFHSSLEKLTTSYKTDRCLQWAYGTYFRSIKTDQKLQCSWSTKAPTLATCLDDVLNNNFDNIFSKIKLLNSLEDSEKQQISLDLVACILNPFLILKKEIQRPIIEACKAILDMCDTSDGRFIFYNTLLALKTEHYNVVLPRDILGNKTNGWLSSLALYILKFYPNLKDSAFNLLSQEKPDFYVSRQDVLQIQMLAYLRLNRLDLYEKSRNYFDKKFLNDMTKYRGKWLLQAEIESLLKHTNKALRFQKIHTMIGKASYLC